jgi:hypothetical protein
MELLTKEFERRGKCALDTGKLKTFVQRKATAVESSIDIHCGAELQWLEICTIHHEVHRHLG